MAKLSGPRMSTGRYYSKGKRGRKPAKKKQKGGLNKTERKQTTQIAKKVINSMAESKYFHVNTCRS